jgi:hypothetical protein
MAKKSTADFIRIMQSKYFPTKYKPETQFISELNLLHSVKLVSVGGEQALNDANSKVEVGISDFNGTLTPTDADGLIRGVAVRFGKSTAVEAPASPALVSYSELKEAFPAWLLNSELILKNRGFEQFRVRIQELVLADKANVVASEWCKELEKTIKVEGGQDLQLFLSTPKGAIMDTAVDKHQYLQVVLYGIKFGDRKNA